MKTAVAYSGGLDSTVLLYWLVNVYGKDNVLPIFANYKAPVLKYARRHANFHVDFLGVPLRVIDVTLPPVITEYTRTFANRKEGSHPYDPREDYAPGFYTIVWALIGAAAKAAHCDELAFGLLQAARDFSEVQSQSLWARFAERAFGFSPESGVWDSSTDFIHMLDAMRVTIWGRDAPVLTTPFADKTKREVVLLGRELGVPLERTHSCDLFPACGRCEECTLRMAALKL